VTDFHVAIPSHGREDSIAEKSLATLLRLGVDPDQVTVFTATDADRHKYERALGLGKWRVVTGVPGKFPCLRHFIGKHYQAGERVVSLDDDICDLLELPRDGGKLAPTDKTLAEIAGLAYRVCEKHGARLWGVCPTANDFYMKRQIVVGLRFVIGCFHGLYAGDEAVCGPRLRPARESVDDYETTVRSFLRHGSVVRFEYLTPKTEMFAEGGLDLHMKELGGTRKEEHCSHSREVAEAWPALAKIRMKGNGLPNVLLKPVTKARLTR
jgi:hypothetical protein